MDPEINVEEAAATISNDLFPAQEEAETPEVLEGEEAPVEGEQAAEGEEAPVEEVQVRAPPKSWAKETHEVWAKVPPEAQEYIELREKQMLDGIEQYKQHSGIGKTLSEIINPYTPLLTAQNIDAPKAIASLMNAHYKLSTLQGDQKVAYMRQIAQTYGVAWPGAENEQPEDPRVRALEEKIARLEGGLTQQQQRDFEQLRTKITADVNSFADEKDEKGNRLRPYFEEVANDILVYLNSGAKLDQDTYLKAVYANPVTRAKEVARLQKEADANLRAKAKQEAGAAKKASAVNVRSRDTKRAPTEPMGKMEDTMRETLADIRSRAH